MASFNKITIVGYLGRDPELRHTPAGDAACSFSVATTEGKGDNAVTTWFRITTWRRQAEIANQYLTKGKQVYIEGRLRTNVYTDKDGNQRTSLEVAATDMQFLGTVGDGAESSPRAPRPRGADVGTERDPQASTRRPLLPDDGVQDSDIPF